MVDEGQAPKVVYTQLIRGGRQPIKQRVFLLGGMNLQQKSAYEHVFEVDLSRAQQAANGGSLVKKSPMPVPKDSFGVCVDSTNQVIYTIGGRDISKKATAKCERYSIAND